MKKQLEKLSKPELIDIILRLEERITALEVEVTRLRKNSSNSSKPPSSDIVKPKTLKGKKGKRKIGGQPGHPKHDRIPFTQDQLDAVWEYTLEQCPDCGGTLKNTAMEGRVVQQVELVEMPVSIEEHRALVYWCARCRTYRSALLPSEITKAGLVGPRLTALVAHLKGACHASYTTIQSYLRDVMKLDLSTGQLAKLIRKADDALGPAYDELLKCLPSESHLNVDETDHKENGDKFWTWCFRADLYTLFKIDASRESQVLVDVLGEQFDGVLGCDYFSAYRKYMDDFNITVQFCLAHLIRDVKFLTTLTDRVTKNYGERVLERLRRLFEVIHRRDTLSKTRFQKALANARDQLIATAKRAPQRSEAQNMAQRFRQHGNAYFRFITTPGIEPTNNLAEQAIRFVVIDRRITQGTRGQAGRQWSERIWTTIATCTQQGRSVFHFIQRAIRAHFTNQPAPSLLFNSS
ncbi:IS66 family transposase [Planctomycetota bacterium]